MLSISASAYWRKVKVSPSRGASFLRRRVCETVTQRRLSVTGSPGEGCCQGRSRKTGAAGARSTSACVFVPIIPLASSPSVSTPLACFMSVESCGSSGNCSMSTQTGCVHKDPTLAGALKTALSRKTSSTAVCSNEC